MNNVKQKINMTWAEYPLGTKAYACTGGYWIKQTIGWKWCTGATFPTPGGDACYITLPEKPDNQSLDSDGKKPQQVI